MNTEFETIIIGGGASGLFASLYAIEGGSVAVLERNNEPAKKIYATGNGRCNYLNSNAKQADLLIKELEKIGISPAEEEGGRLYPRSREASYVAQALVFAAQSRGVEIICDCHVTDVQKKEQGYGVISKDGRRFSCRRLVIATGGKAGIQFGCYGEGYRWAQYLGHSIVKPVPALVPVEASEDISPLSGVRVRGRVGIVKNGSLLAEDTGEIQFTKDSISGICVMNLSRGIRLADGDLYTLCMDFFPEYTINELTDILQNRSICFKSYCGGLLPKKLAEYIERNSEDAQAAAMLCKQLSFTVKGTKGWSDAQVTSGGISLDELDPDSMQSLKHPGLYFTGEVTDYDGPCGGYNLSYAFLSGMSAGKDIAKNGK